MGARRRATVPLLLLLAGASVVAAHQRVLLAKPDMPPGQAKKEDNQFKAGGATQNTFNPKVPKWDGDATISFPAQDKLCGARAPEGIEQQVLSGPLLGWLRDKGVDTSALNSRGGNPITGAGPASLTVDGPGNSGNNGNGNGNGNNGKGKTRRSLLLEMPLTTVNTYVHVILKNDGSQNVPDDRIRQNIGILNQAFSDFRFTFKLVAIQRFLSDAWFGASSGSWAEWNMKNQLRLGGARTLNIYINKPSNGTLGYVSGMPWHYSTANKWYDGVVIMRSTLPAGNSYPYDLGKTLVHEVGHWLGLFHTFANNKDGSCSGDPWWGGDIIPDTPAEAIPAYGCPVGRDTCTDPSIPTSAGIDPVRNYMDYSDDDCMGEFTKEQGLWMQFCWDTYRCSRVNGVCTLPP